MKNRNFDFFAGKENPTDTDYADFAAHAELMQDRDLRDIEDVCKPRDNKPDKGGTTMNAQEAEKRLQAIIPEDMAFRMDVNRWFYTSGGKRPGGIETTCSVWLPYPTGDNITDSTWQLVVDRVQAKLQGPETTEIPDLEFGGKGGANCENI